MFPSKDIIKLLLSLYPQLEFLVSSQEASVPEIELPEKI